MERINFADILKAGCGFASHDLREELESKKSENDFIVNFAYTDYGGDFFDKVAIEYFIKEYPENTIWENTHYYGKNCFIFGEVAKEFWEAQEKYLLGFENMEEFYYNMEREVTEKDFEFFLNDIKNKYVFDFEKAFEYLLENFSGYYAIHPQGIDFCTSDLIEKLLTADVIFKENEKLLYLFLKAGFEKSIAIYYVSTFENGNIAKIQLNEETKNIFKSYEALLLEA